MSLLQVFLLNQLDLWGVIPAVWVVFIVAYKRQVAWHDLLMWTAVFSVFVAAYSYANPIIHLLAIILSSSVCIGLMALTMSFKPTRKLVWVQALIGVCAYVLVFHAISIVGVLGEVSKSGALRSLSLSVLVNFGLAYASIRLSNQHKVVR